MITLRGQILASRTDDDPSPLSSPLHPVYPFKTPPCLYSERSRVCLHHAHMLKHMCAWCWHTRRRFESTHGGFQRATPHRTHTHTPQPQPQPQRHTPQPTPQTPHALPHTTSHAQHQTETDRERQRKKTETERKEKIKDERRDKRR